MSAFTTEFRERLTASRVLIVGLGGLGSPAALYLAAAGVGHLVLADFDRVDLSNLQRQIIYRSADLGRFKVESARDALTALNPQVRVTTLDRRPDWSPGACRGRDRQHAGAGNPQTAEWSGPGRTAVAMGRAGGALAHPLRLHPDPACPVCASNGKSSAFVYY